MYSMYKSNHLSFSNNTTSSKLQTFPKLNIAFYAIKYNHFH